LTETEIAQLNEKLQDEDSVLSLRKKAMILLGLKMGLRSFDIVYLKYEDIDWKNSSIRFIQSKTEVEINLPMPAEVGNAIYRYITQERHTKPREFEGRALKVLRRIPIFKEKHNFTSSLPIN
jgi:integrase